MPRKKVVKTVSNFEPAPQPPFVPPPAVFSPQTVVTPPVQMPQRRFSPMMIAVAGLAIIFVGLIGFLAWQNHRLNNARVALEKQLTSGQNQQTSGQSNGNQTDEVKSLVEAVGKLMILPTDEQPTIATVTDLAKLQGQPFFANAAVGDKVLIYQNAKKAVLYRPSTNQIIELAPLTGTASTSDSSQSGLPTVEIRNGSGKGGAAAVWKTKLESSGQFTVSKIGNAASTYPKALIYISDGQRASTEQVNHLTTLTGAQTVSALPAGEASTTADVLLILGKQ